MRRATFLLIASITLVVLARCTPAAGVFRCTSPSQCRTRGSEGQCEPLGYCSVPDTTCPSGWTYDRSAGDGLAGTCVPSSGNDGFLDGGALDAGVDGGLPEGGGPSLCPGVGLSLCEGFEAALPSAPFTFEPIGGSVVVEPGRVYRGQSAAHLRTNAGTASGTSQLSAVVKERTVVSTAQLNMRAFFYVPTGYPPSRMRLLGVFQSNAPFVGLLLAVDPGGGFSMENSITDTTTTGGLLPLDRWVCLELEVVANTGGQNNGSARVFMDGIEVAALTTSNVVTSTSPPPGIVEAGLSFHSLTADVPARDGWIDELAVATSRIGCTR